MSGPAGAGLPAATQPCPVHRDPLPIVAFRAPQILIDAIDKAARDSHRPRSNLIRILLGKALGISCDQFDLEESPPQVTATPGLRDAQ